MEALPTKALIRAAVFAVARLAVRWGIKLPELSALLKESLLVAARRDLAQREEKETTSKLSVMTGIHRKFIPELLKAPPTVSQQNLIDRVIDTWQRSRTFSSNRGPRALTVVGPESEFAKLVSSVNADLNPYTVLFEMERLSLITRSNDQAQLNSFFFNTRADIPQSARLTEQSVVDMAAAVHENVTSKAPTPHLHLTTEYDAIPDSALAELRRWILEEGSSFHARLRAKLSSLDAELNPLLQNEAGRNRVTVSAFSFVEPTNRRER